MMRRSSHLGVDCRGSRRSLPSVLRRGEAGGMRSVDRGPSPFARVCLRCAPFFLLWHRARFLISNSIVSRPYGTHTLPRPTCHRAHRPPRTGTRHPDPHRAPHRTRHTSHDPSQPQAQPHARFGFVAVRSPWSLALRGCKSHPRRSDTAARRRHSRTDTRAFSYSYSHSALTYAHKHRQRARHCSLASPATPHSTRPATG